MGIIRRLFKQKLLSDKKIGHKMSIRKQMIVFVICFILLPVLLFTYIFNWFMVKEVRKNVEISVENSLILTEVNLDNLRINIINACISSANDAETMEFLKSDSNKNDFQKSLFAKKIENMVTVNLGGAEIYGAIIGLSGDTFNLFNERNNALAKDFFSFPDKYRSITWSVQREFDSHRAPFIVCTCPIYGKDTSTLIGISIVAISQEDFQGIINKSRNYKSYEAIIVDQDDKIVSYYDKSFIGKHIDNMIMLKRGKQSELMATKKATDEKYLYFDKGITIGSAWRAITLISYDEVFLKIDRIAQLNNVLVLMVLVCSMGGVLVVAGTISRPIIALRDYISEYPKNKKMLAKMRISSFEADSLYDSYIQQMNIIETLITKIEQDKRKVNDLQFKALQAQINPHFLFNTLNNIKMLSFIKGCNEVGLMIAELGKLLEVSIYFDTAIVKIGEELDYVTSYVKLQNIHFEGNLHLINRIPNEMFEYQILKFTLQPILENSIKHGFSSRKKDCVIELAAEEKEDALILYIKDNGDGFSESKLCEIKEKLSSREETDRVGLYNINERIKLSFGDEYGLNICSKKGEYTIVEVKIPKSRGNKYAEGNSC